MRKLKSRNKSVVYGALTVREGAKVLYRIKDVRNYLKMQPVYENTLEYFQAKKEEYLGLPAVLNDDLDRVE